VGAQPADRLPTPEPAGAGPDEHHPAETETPGAAADQAGAVRVAVTLTDALRIEPAEMTVPVGVPVTFVVTNAGVIPHEFVVGDEAT
jgi:hypothetical protein